MKKQITKKITYIIFFLIILLLVVLYKKAEIRFFIAAGDSMYPTIKKGAIVCIKNSQNYKKKDIISYRYKNMKNHIVTHRIVEIESFDGRYLYQTKGDNNDCPDNILVTKSEIIGKFVFTIPYLGNLINLFFTPYLFAFFFYVPLGFFVGREVKALKISF